MLLLFGQRSDYFISNNWLKLSLPGLRESGSMETISKAIIALPNPFVLLHQVLELICTREAGAVFEAGGLACVLSFIRDNASIIHKDTLHSAMSVVSR